LALSSTTVWEVEVEGSDLNGGGFDSAYIGIGTDYSQQGSPQVIIDGATITATVNSTTTKWDIVGYITADTDIGNIVQISGGAMTAGFYRITGQTGGNQWTVDRAAGTVGQAGIGRMGGAFGSPGMGTSQLLNNGMKCWIKYGTYTLTSSISGSNGPLTGGNDVWSCEGYYTYRGDFGTPPIISAGSLTNINLWPVGDSISNGPSPISNIVLDGNHGTGNNGFTGGYAVLNKVVMRNFDGATNTYGCYRMKAANNCTAISCGIGFSQTPCYKNTARNCTYGFDITGSPIVQCIAYNNTNGFFNGSSTGWIFRCVAYNNVNGFNISNSFTSCQDSIAINNSYYGWATLSNFNTYVNCYGYLNTSGNVQNIPYVTTITTLSADPFISASTGDFRLNTAAGGGALLRSTGIGVYGQIDNTDIGAVQHADPSQPLASQVKAGVVYNDNGTTGSYGGGGGGSSIFGSPIIRGCK
jgi:hypothetical protein